MTKSNNENELFDTLAKTIRQLINAQRLASENWECPMVANINE